MNLRSLSIAPRAALGFGLIALLVFLLGGFALLQMASMHERSGEVEENWVPSLNALNDVTQSIMRLQASTLRAVLTEDNAHLQTSVTQAQQLRSTLQDRQQVYEKLISSEQERSQYQRFKQLESDYLQAQSQVLERAQAGDHKAASTLVEGDLNSHADQMVTALNDLIVQNRDGASAAAKASSAIYDRALSGTLAVMALAAVATLLLATLLTRSIARPLADAVEVANSVAAGDLNRIIDA